jgi:hypothetical protein
MPYPLSRVLLVLLALTMLIGADGCPFSTNDSTTGTTGTTGTAMDVGGTQGAIWNLSFASEILVTLRSGTKIASKSATTTAPVQLLGSTLSLADFCWRTDVVCPQQVLPAQTMLIQPSSTPGALVAGFNRRGPLEALVKEAGLVGQVDGKELTVPLNVGGAAAGWCGLAASSKVLASASASSGSGSQADALQGRVTVVYSGSCVDIGGTGAIDPTATVDLGASFTGKRQ